MPMVPSIPSSAGGQTSSGPSVTYHALNDAINETFFNSDIRLTPIYLDLEEEFLTSVAAKLGISEEQVPAAIARAVNSTIKLPNKNPFDWHLGELEAWNDLGCFEAPPFSALLLALSLAAERMRNEGQYSAHNYYDRLFELLSLKDVGYQKKIKLNFGSTVPLWNGLNKWLLDNDYEYGRPTAQRVNSWPFVSYALSQALVRDGELLGHPVPMKRLPVLDGGRRVQTEKGLGTVFEEPPEVVAKNRWHDGIFEQAEYELAKSWRKALAANPAAMQSLLGGNPHRFTFRDFPQAKKKADELIEHGTRVTTLKALLAILLPPHLHVVAMKRWKDAGGPPLREFAPYSVHILTVDLFKVLAMGSGILSIDKTSNYVDLAYLYYLPFAELFVSTDKLHRNVAPLFMDGKQHFVWGNDLRPVLANLAADYSADSRIEEVGLIKLAGQRKFEAGTFMGDLFEKMRPGKGSSRHEEDLSSRLTPEAEAKLVEMLKRQIESPPPAADADLGQEDQMSAIQRKVPGRRGSFAFLPKKVRDSIKDE